jgi:tRNA A22 N-methylase
MHGETVKCVSAVLVIQRTMHVRYTVICGLSGCTIFFHIISKRHDFRKKKVIEYKMSVLIFVQHVS